MQTPKRNSWALFKRQGNALVPHAPYDHEILSMFPEGVPLRASFAQPRSLPRHRLYWVVLRLVIKNSNYFATVEGLHKTLLTACGVTEPLITLEGEIVLIPSSIAFEKMEESEFKEYFDAALDAISTRVIPGVDINELLNEAKREARWTEKEAA